MRAYASQRRRRKAVDVGVAAGAAIKASGQGSSSSGSRSSSRRQRRSAKAALTVRIIMALVFSIMQQQQVLNWPCQNGPFAVAAIHNNYNNNSSHSNSNSDSYNNVSREDFHLKVLSSSVAAMLPQTAATNNTFKSFAFLASASDSFAYSLQADDFAATATASETERETERELSESLPIFDFGMPRNITGRTGHTEAIIKCRVDSLHDKSVSWIRKRDLHILTVGTATYTSDKRFEVSESKDTRDWTLHVKSPLAKDSGVYECQVNTEPKMSMAFQLNIIEISPDAKAIISGPHDLHFKAGSAIILHCLVKQPSVKDIGPIYWYRGEHLITPLEADDDETESPRELHHPLDQKLGQLNQSLNEVLSTDLQKEFATRIAMESQLGDTLKSRLRISNAQITDTGIYTCQPTTANSASVMVHVIDDENPAAMQKSAALSMSCKDAIFWSMLGVLLAKYWLTTGSSSN